jgi:hypothetical protein
MIERMVLVCGILGLLVPGMAQEPFSSNEQLESPGIRIAQVNSIVFMVTGQTLLSVEGDSLNMIGDLPGVRRDRLDNSTYLLILPPISNSSSVPVSSLSTDSCKARIEGNTCDCPRSGCLNCAQCYSQFPFGAKCCNGNHHQCCPGAYGYQGLDCMVVFCA